MSIPRDKSHGISSEGCCVVLILRCPYPFQGAQGAPLSHQCQESLPDAGVLIDQHRGNILAKTIPLVDFSNSPYGVFSDPTALPLCLNKRELFERADNSCPLFDAFSYVAAGGTSIWPVPKKRLFLRIRRLTRCEHIFIKMNLLNIKDLGQRDFALSGTDYTLQGSKFPRAIP